LLWLPLRQQDCRRRSSPTVGTQEEIDEKRAAYLRAGAHDVWICDRHNRMKFSAPSGKLSRSRLCPDFPLELDLSQRPINKLQQQLLAASDQLVRTPEDRARLEKENPDLVASAIVS
jgi:hypothetical protein